jgi:hypothetical protein
MVIITIILGFILNAAMDSVRRSEERATQTLITKLEAGLSDRIDALLQTRPDYNFAHYYMGGIWIPQQPFFLPGTQRAQVIAWYDYIKAELPDVFFVQNQNPTGASYPLNFVGRVFPGTDPGVLPSGVAPYILPLGNAIVNNPAGGSYGDFVGTLPQTNPNLGPSGSGIYGASYTAAAGIYKNLGYLPAGYDGVDNNGNGLIDEWAEGVNSTNQSLVQARLQNHTHITARAEMLYALLVEGRGPLGSVFSPDDFTDREVRDTDNDGLPEFVDAWGQPIQFFRWPLLYHSDVQRGQVIVNSTNLNSYQAVSSTYTVGSLVPPYLTPFEQREQSPLDLNQQLMAPAWWSTGGGGGYTANSSSPFATQISAPPPAPAGVSGGVLAFQYFFHRLTEPFGHNGASTNYWDRSGTYPARRAFYSKFLIMSSGPDLVPGVFVYTDAALGLLGKPDNVCAALLLNENNAMQFGLDVADFTAPASQGFVSAIALPTVSSNDPINNPNSYDIQQAGQDDISNHSLQTTGGIGGS